MGSRWMRNSFVYLLILVAVIAIVVAFFRPSSGSHPKQDLSTVISDANAATIQKLVNCMGERTFTLTAAET